MARDPPSSRFEAAYGVLVLVFLLGIHLDSRSHVHDAPESFLTVEHAVFYAAAAGIGLLLAGAALAARRRGARGRAPVPAGYGLAAAGVVLFALAGLGDMAWHRAFGIEADIEALVSPTHLLLAAGGFLFASAPLRSALARRRRPRSWRGQLPAAVGALGGLGVLAFMVQFLHPVAQPVPDPSYQGSIGLAAALAGWILVPALLAGTALALDAGLDLQPGHLTAIFLADGLLQALAHDRWLLALPLIPAALAAEAVVAGAAPSPRRERVLGAAVGLAMGLTYFPLLAATSGITWSVHLWTGAIALAAAGGTLAGLAVTLPGTRAARR